VVFIANVVPLHCFCTWRNVKQVKLLKWLVNGSESTNVNSQTHL